ncbi:MAG: hypothetical protein AAFZ15_24810 [Bacteroidota bacterium]
MNQSNELQANYSGDENSSTADVVETVSEADHLILGSKTLHDLFINVCPELETASAESIEIISKLIYAFFFGKISILNLIKDICGNDIIIETIQGIGIIIQDEKIKDIQGIEKYFEDIQIAIPSSIIDTLNPVPLHQ